MEVSELWKLELTKNYGVRLGTAGVWRIAALNEAGGWKDRTTVEDMDLAVRASLKGWKFVYVGDLKVFLLHFSILMTDIEHPTPCNYARNPPLFERLRSGAKSF